MIMMMLLWLLVLLLLGISVEEGERHSGMRFSLILHLWKEGKQLCGEKKGKGKKRKRERRQMR